jgi:glucosamine--fructose-6-phosphate aminotransferase (isomerizing)
LATIEVNGDGQNQLQRRRALGKVAQLEALCDQNPAHGHVGIAHTRWATHGKPCETNAHPHISGKPGTQKQELAIVHNGIIENFEPLKAELQARGVEFTSATDSEVIAHLLAEVYCELNDLKQALKVVLDRLKGAYALAVLHVDNPDQLLVARHGSPLVAGLGYGENFIASDPLALLSGTDRFIYLEEGDIAQISKDQVLIWDAELNPVNREAQTFEHKAGKADKGDYPHYMLKEIFEQPKVIEELLHSAGSIDSMAHQAFGENAEALIDKIRNIQIVSCGTSYNAGSVARYWLESIAGIPCQVEIASEYRYRINAVPEGTLLITISQSGETADTLAALRKAKSEGHAQGYVGTLAICNVPGSSLVRESEYSLFTHAGPEIGVASTKAFTTQLVTLLLLTLTLAEKRQQASTAQQQALCDGLIDELKRLPEYINHVLELDAPIKRMSECFINRHHALFLGRDTFYPVAVEGALKLKEISYIHAEAYAGGELKHGPLALVDHEMPIVAVVPSGELQDKIAANLQEVKSRGGELHIFVENGASFKGLESKECIELPKVHPVLGPIVHSVPLQLLAYHVAVLKGTDVDQPRNLAKSVTVE